MAMIGVQHLRKICEAPVRSRVKGSAHSSLKSRPLKRSKDLALKFKKGRFLGFIGSGAGSSKLL